MDLGIANRVALVVGGTGLIGRAVAESLLAEGATVVVGSRNPGTLAGEHPELFDRTGQVQIDTLDEHSVQAAVDSVVAEYGSIDILVNTAAPSARTLDSSKDRDPAQVLGAIDGKAMGYLRCANAVLPLMKEAGFGRVINVSGQNAFLTGSVTGSVRNSATIVMSKNLADLFVGTGVTVNVVNPGFVVPEPSTAVQVGRAGETTPAQVAALVTYLASAQAAAVSGESIAVGHRVLGVQ
ncbi:SDR family oxidoreductase [soil metagenome]